MNLRNRSWNRLKAGAAVFLFFIGAVAAASSHRHRSAHQSSQPGVFDYYVLTLSWSPEFCHSHAASPECQSRRFGFIVHGLWPQFVKGYPENCSTAPGLSDPSAMLDIMPDPHLVEHEWTTHGTCSGLDADQYFKLIRLAFSSIKIPARFNAPGQAFSQTPAEIKQDFLQSNPRLGAQDLTVGCGNNYLTAVSVCMTKTLEPKACEALPECHANSVRVPPVR
jgi:ribonuclease T2